jgi:transposase
VLFAAEGLHDTEIAVRLDMTPGIVGKWRRRFAEQRLEGLKDKPRSGRPRRFPPTQVAAVKAVACELPIRYGLPLSRFCRTELHRLVIELAV